MVNSALDGIPTYLMSLIPVPSEVGKKINKLRRDFIWEGNAENRKIHLVNWEKITRCKEEGEGGGLGVRDLKVHNKSLSCK